MTDVQKLAETVLGRAERFSVKAELKRAGEILDDGEEVELLAVGSYEGAGNSLILVTDRRVIALNETGGIFGKKLAVHDVPYSRITSVSSQVGRVHGAVTLASSGGDMEIERILPPGRAAELAGVVRRRL